MLKNFTDFSRLNLRIVSLEKLFAFHLDIKKHGQLLPTTGYLGESGVQPNYFNVRDGRIHVNLVELT